jgi:predicted AAA+ superfamily ATPase
MDLHDTLIRINEWWDTGKVPEELVPPRQRKLFDDILNVMDDRRILCITGPRRTGKTTMMYQLMDHLIRESHAEPKDILFFSGDDAELRSHDDLLGNVVRTYFEDVLRRGHRERRCWVFIDEVHRISDWQLWLKKYYDMKYDIKFVISGSSVTKMRSDRGESLAGRIMEFRLYPLTFSEFLEFNGYERFKAGFSSKIDLGMLKELAANWRSRSLDIRKHLDEYLIVGGFPEWFETRNVRLWQRKLSEDAVKRVVYDDIAVSYGVKNATRIESLLRLFASLSGQIYSYNSVSNALHIDNETAEQYIRYLRESLLVFELRNYAASVERQVRKNYKYTVIDIGLRNALERTRKTSASDTGHIVESVVQLHVIQWAEREDATVFYWRDRNEVDLVVQTPNGLIPIEVKYRGEVGHDDIKGLLTFMDKYRVKRGIVVTKDVLERKEHEGMEILLIPAWLMLLML